MTKKIEGGDTTLFLHVFNGSWPKDGRLVVPDLMNEVVEAHLLKLGVFGSHKKLKTVSVPYAANKNAASVTISVPKKPPDKFSSTIVLKLKGEPKIYLGPGLTD